MRPKPYLKLIFILALALSFSSQGVFSYAESERLKNAVEETNKLATESLGDRENKELLKRWQDALENERKIREEENPKLKEAATALNKVEEDYVRSVKEVNRIGTELEEIMQGIKEVAPYKTQKPTSSELSKQLRKKIQEFREERRASRCVFRVRNEKLKEYEQILLGIEKAEKKGQGPPPPPPKEGGPGGPTVVIGPGGPPGEKGPTEAPKKPECSPDKEPIIINPEKKPETPKEKELREKIKELEGKIKELSSKAQDINVKGKELEKAQKDLSEAKQKYEQTYKEYCEEQANNSSGIKEEIENTENKLKQAIKDSEKAVKEFKGATEDKRDAARDEMRRQNCKVTILKNTIEALESTKERLKKKWHEYSHYFEIEQYSCALKPDKQQLNKQQQLKQKNPPRFADTDKPETQKFLKDVDNIKSELLKEKYGSSTDEASKEFEKDSEAQTELATKLYNYIKSNVEKADLFSDEGQQVSEEKLGKWKRPQTSSETLQRGEGACLEMSYLMNMALEQAGVASEIVGGNTSMVNPEKTGHVWNRITLPDGSVFDMDLAQTEQPVIMPPSHTNVYKKPNSLEKY